MAFDACMAAIARAAWIPPSAAHGTEGRAGRQQMDFSDVYYNDGDQVIVIMKDSADQYKITCRFCRTEHCRPGNGTLQYDLVTTQIPDAKCEVVSAVTDGIYDVKDREGGRHCPRKRSRRQLSLLTIRI